MTRSPKELALEDRILWSRVAETAKPLRGKPPLPRIEPVSETTPETPVRLALGGTAREAVARRPAHTLYPIDRTTHRKIAKGRIEIEARVDLHGLTQGEAHGFLLGFLQRAQAQGVRYALVITGKGSSLGSLGVLRQAVPAWFATPAFRVFVSGYEDAARGHGGDGALYVRIRQRAEKGRRR